MKTFIECLVTTLCAMSLFVIPILIIIIGNGSTTSILFASMYMLAYIGYKIYKDLK